MHHIIVPQVTVLSWHTITWQEIYGNCLDRGEMCSWLLTAVVTSVFPTLNFIIYVIFLLKKICSTQNGSRFSIIAWKLVPAVLSCFNLWRTLTNSWIYFHTSSRKLMFLVEYLIKLNLQWSSYEQVQLKNLTGSLQIYHYLHSHQA